MNKRTLTSLRKALLKLSSDLLPLESAVSGFSPPYSFEEMNIIQDVDQLAMTVADIMAILEELEQIDDV